MASGVLDLLERLVGGPLDLFLGVYSVGSLIGVSVSPVFVENGVDVGRRAEFGFCCLLFEALFVALLTWTATCSVRVIGDQFQASNRGLGVKAR
jgi:hypothetical protein